MNQISYAHKDDPTGTRFHDLASSKLPPWAVDVKQEQYPLNAYGFPYHATDTYIHWTERTPGEKMKQLRTIYDKIITSGVSVKELEVLLGAAYDSGRSDENDCNNEDI
jgi:hypothetical protein